MEIRFDARVVLISGGAVGIGRAIAAGFASSGARVHIADIDPNVMRVADEINCAAHILDLADRSAAAALVDEIAASEGRLDILALAAGGVGGMANLPLQDVTEENWEVVFRSNVQSALWLAQAAAPVMQRSGWGRIVVISSGSGLRPTLTGLHAYTAAKHAAIGLTKQLSAGLGKSGITVNSVAPGLVLTNAATRRQWDGYGADGQRQMLDGLHTGRLAQPDDIAAAVLFLSSKQAGSITGQVLSVDGGRL